MELLLGTPSRNPRERGLHNSLSSIHRFQLHTTSTINLKHYQPHTHFPSYATATPSASPRHHSQASGTNAFGEKAFKRHVHGQVQGQQDYYTTRVDALLAALRQNDTVKLYFRLLDLTSGAQPYHVDFCRAVRSIPSTTFSEILRSFDPFRISRHLDSAPGIPISWGAAIYTPLGELINKWGVKTLYVRIFNRLRLLQDARRHLPPGSNDSSIRPLLHDYLVLLRCAGAITSIQSAKKIWHELFTDGYALWKNPQLFTEFIRARFLTESLYATNDLSRFRLRPLDMHRNGATYLTTDKLRKLRYLRAALLYKRHHRFGQNTHEPFFAEPLTRLLRKRKPLRRLQRRVIIRHMLPGDEPLLCAILKANGRQGQVYASKLLLRFWGISVTPFKKDLGRPEITGGYDFAAGAAQAPTAALLDAVVHCWGSQGEMRLATALVDFISRRWNIPVPDHVWSDLLGYARIHATEPATTEWRIVQMRTKISSPKSVVDIWQLCTQAPYHFQPSMKDYQCLIKSVLRPMRSIAKALAAVRQVTPLYRRIVRQVQDAWAELILTTQQGVSNHTAYRRYRMLLATKYYMWYCLHYTSIQAGNVVKPSRVDDVNAVRWVPDLVAEIGSFMTPVIQYRIATGVVDLRLDNAPLETVVSRQMLQRPKDLSHRPLIFTKTFKDSKASKDTSGRQSSFKKDSVVNVDWPFANLSLGKEDPAAVLRGIMGQLGVGDPWQDGQSDSDDYKDEEDEEDEDMNEFMEQAQHNNRHRVKPENTFVGKKGTVAGADASDAEDERGVLSRTPSRPDTHFQDAFEESRNPGNTSSLGDYHEELSGIEGSPRRDPFEDAFASIHQNHIDHTGTQHSDDWDEGKTTDGVKTTRRRDWAWQTLNRPAYMMRPRYNAPAGEPSLSAMQQDGHVFTGYHRDPLKKHFAAHRIIRSMKHAPGVPVDLSGAAASETRLMDHLLRIKT